MRTKTILVILTMLLGYSFANAAYTSPGWSYGYELGIARGDNAGSAENIGPLGRGYVQLEIFPAFSARIGGGYTKLHANKLYDAHTLMADARFILQPFRQAKYSPFIYLGQGASLQVGNGAENMLPLIPIGIGFQTRLKRGIMLEVTTGYNLSNSDQLDGKDRLRADDDMNRFTNKKQDGFFSLTVGLSYYNPGPEPAPKQVVPVISVKPVPTPTPPPPPPPAPVIDLKSQDSDGDKLSDADEINQYKTDPYNADTDGDGLNDYIEVMQYKTNPLNPDSDGDKLKDGEEVLTYKTNPLNPDSDNDGLKDGEEVLTYKTNPLDPDTDKGSVNDGTEVKENKNPLDPKDDVMELKKGVKISLEGILFETGKAVIVPASTEILEKAYTALAANPDVNVIIIGHTDNVGSASSNQVLSLKRAEAVKSWLVNKGLNASRIQAVGKGATEPRATNNTPEGRTLNRRIEFEVAN